VKIDELKVFKEITVGGLTKVQLIQRLVEANVRLNKYAEILVEHFTFSPEDETEKVKLVRVKLSDLKLDNPCSFEEIVNRATAGGLKLCPLYLGAFLRLEYLDQPDGPFLTVASANPEKDENYPNGFYLRNFENSLWLRGYKATDQCEWPNDNEFIFVK
jgi:hypothetical protein